MLEIREAVGARDTQVLDDGNVIACFTSKEDAELFVRAKLTRAEMLKAVMEAFVKQTTAQPHHFADNDGRCVFCGLPRGSANLPLKCQPMTPTQNEVAAGRYPKLREMVEVSEALEGIFRKLQDADVRPDHIIGGEG